MLLRSHSIYISTLSVPKAVDQKSKGRRFESCARTIFRNAHFMQPLFWRLYVVAVLITLKPDGTLNVE